MQQRWGHLPQLDGLRGIAILLVVAVHATGWPTGGHLGVDLFFVLSGFLITSLLLEERAQTGRVSLRGFYGRRARRLLPALALLLSTFLMIDALKGHDGLRTAALAGLYFGNVVQAFSIPNPLEHSGLEHLWTLAEEEQFYLLWPLLLPFVVRSRRAVQILAVVIGLMIVWRFLLAFHGANHERLYNGPDTHADGLIAGTAIAFFYRERPNWKLSGGIATVGFGIFGIALFGRTATPLWDVFGLPLAETGCVIVLLAALTIPEWTRVLSWMPLRWFGWVSYSLYLWHYMLMWAFGWQCKPLAAVLAIGIAYASTRWFEEPIRQRRKPFLLGRVFKDGFEQVGVHGQRVGRVGPIPLHIENQ